MRFYFDEVEELVDDEEDFVEEEELVDDEEELERFFEFLSKNLFLLSRFGDFEMLFFIIFEEIDLGGLFLLRLRLRLRLGLLLNRLYALPRFLLRLRLTLRLRL